MRKKRRIITDQGRRSVRAESSERTRSINIMNLNLYFVLQVLYDLLYNRL